MRLERCPSIRAAVCRRVVSHLAVTLTTGCTSHLLPSAWCACQVNDISMMGNPIEVAQLILPRGSTLLATATQQVQVPPKQTPVGPLELPPQTYYRCGADTAACTALQRPVICPKTATGTLQLGRIDSSVTQCRGMFWVTLPRDVWSADREVVCTGVHMWLFVRQQSLLQASYSCVPVASACLILAGMSSQRPRVTM